MKKIILSILCIILTTGMVFAAKYKVNSSGTVKTNTGTNVSNPNLYSVYTPSNYNAQTNTATVQIIDLVMDYSGSMSNWIAQAKRTMSAIISQIPPTTLVGLRVFGQDTISTMAEAKLGTIEKIEQKNGKIKVSTKSNPVGNTTGYCAATSSLVGLTAANANALVAGMNSAKIGGSTPMVYGLDRAVNVDFSGLDKTTPKKLILISDGGENCGGDPCAFAKRLMAQRTDVHIDVILVGSSSNKLSCLASTTGGSMYKVNDISKFSTVLTQSMQSAPTVQTQNPQQQYEFYKD